MTRSRTYFGNYTICDLSIQANTELRSNRNSGRKSRASVANGKHTMLRLQQLQWLPGFRARIRLPSSPPDNKEGPNELTPLLLSDEMKELTPRPRCKVGSYPGVCRCIYYAIIVKRRKEISKSGEIICRRQQSGI